MDSQAVHDLLEQARQSALFSARKHREIAFYGGTFASLPDQRIRELLGAAAPYLQERIFHSYECPLVPTLLTRRRRLF